MPGGSWSGPKTYLIGIPWSQGRLDHIAAARLALYKELVLLELGAARRETDADIDRLANRKLADWLDKVVDNMAAKSTAFLGLLSLGSALVGLSILTKTGNSRYSSALLVLIFVIAILQFANLRVVAWRDPEVYRDPAKEAAALMRLARNRSARLMCGVFLFLLGGIAWAWCELIPCWLCDTVAGFAPLIGETPPAPPSP